MYEDIDEIDFADKSAADDKAVVLDVRTIEEWDSGHLKNALHIDFFSPEFSKKLDELDKSKNYYVYCRSGNRSGKACTIMAEQGFSGELYNLDGGIMAWTGDLDY